MSPRRFLRRFYGRVESIIDPLLPKEQADFWREKSTVDQVVLLTQNIEVSFEVLVQYLPTWQGHTIHFGTMALPASCWGFCDQNDHRTCLQPKFHPYYRWQQAQQVSPSKKRRSSGNDLGSSSFQHQYVRPALHDFQKVYLCRRSSIVAFFGKLKGLGDFKTVVSKMGASTPWISLPEKGGAGYKLGDWGGAGVIRSSYYKNSVTIIFLLLVYSNFMLWFHLICLSGLPVAECGQFLIINHRISSISSQLDLSYILWFFHIVTLTTDILTL